MLFVAATYLYCCMSSVCIIIPCYNESKRLNLHHFESFLSAHQNYSICFADDGSTDNTYQLLQQLQGLFPQRISLIKAATNSGKAAIIRMAINNMYSQTHFDYYGYFDADLSTPLTAAIPFVQLLDENPVLQMIYGSRITMPGVEIHKNYLRHLGGRTFSFIVNHYFKLTLYDTQCGAKVLRSEMVPVVFDTPFLSRWLFDIEIILRMRKKKLDDNVVIKEVPLHYWSNRKGSKITVADLFKLPLEMVRIKKHYHRTI